VAAGRLCASKFLGARRFSLLFVLPIALLELCEPDCAALGL